MASASFSIKRGSSEQQQRQLELRYDEEVLGNANSSTAQQIVISNAKKTRFLPLFGHYDLCDGNSMYRLAILADQETGEAKKWVMVQVSAFPNNCLCTNLQLCATASACPGIMKNLLDKVFMAERNEILLFINKLWFDQENTGKWYLVDDTNAARAFPSSFWDSSPENELLAFATSCDDKNVQTQIDPASIRINFANSQPPLEQNNDGRLIDHDEIITEDSQVISPPGSPTIKTAVYNLFGSPTGRKVLLSEKWLSTIHKQLDADKSATFQARLEFMKQLLQSAGTKQLCSQFTPENASELVRAIHNNVERQLQTIRAEGKSD